eukprot:TRINITY_DN2620_c0_g1_i6.p1 TRINITY_DN2620_c0_g1~~TRINITY_DN2620_c0_g1_i6.p1  ORF type:complete len:214 (-),score=44.62 TRINITY_DN2620_c0_g1_i6:402-1043(-)
MCLVSPQNTHTLSHKSIQNCRAHRYFVTIIFDTTVGVVICYIILKFLENIFMRFKLKKFKSGNYFKELIMRGGDDDYDEEGNYKPRKKIVIDYVMWIIQLVLWNFIVFLSKIILYAIQFLSKRPLEIASDFVLGGLKTFPNLKLVIVMVIIPCVMNTVQFWVQDNFLKKNDFDSSDRGIINEYYDEIEMSDIYHRIDYEDSRYSIFRDAKGTE